MNRRELEMHLQDLFEGRIEAEALHDLEQQLRADPDARDLYRDYAHLHNALQLRADGIDLLHVVSMDRVVERRQRRYLRNAFISAAALLAISAVIAGLIMATQPQPPRLTATATADTRWTVDGEAQDPREGKWVVSKGATVRVLSGTVKLRPESGAAMVMQGPALASFPELEMPVLHHGWLWIDSADSGLSFEVGTPELLVRDVGTRFGVRVPEQGPAEVHLIDGQVDVFAKSTLKKIASLEPEERGVTITPTGELTGLALERDPFPELDELLTRPASYPTTVRSQNPVGYWRLDETGGGALVDEVAPGRVGRRQPAVKTGVSGPSPAGGFRGFSRENRAFHLSGSPGKPPLLLGSTMAHSGVLFRDDFDGAGPLNGTRPDVTLNDAKWMAVSSPSKFGADGGFEGAGETTAPNRGGSATLAFTPVDGVVYTLEASLRGVKTTGAWIALGFADGQSSMGGKRRRFADGEVSGRAWMLARDGKESRPNQAFLGTSGTTGGGADGSSWAGPLANAPGGDLDLRVVLDTSGGPGNWNATWWAKRAADHEYTKVRDTATLINESITSVGLALSAGGIIGTVDQFSLRADPVTSGRSNPQQALAPANVARKEGAVSFWMRREPGKMRREMLWSAGETPQDASLHTHLAADGRVGFFIENGRYDVLVTSEESIANGRWHHLAASWSPSSVDLYVDGRLVANDTDHRGIQQGILPELRFGGGPPAFKTAPFSGWIDEIALWDRALTPAEVQHQVRSAEGVK
jgi:hypothetical protein